MTNKVDPKSGWIRAKNNPPRTLEDFQKWPWSCNDITTWKYIDCHVSERNGITVFKWILNPDFAYAHLDIDN